MSTLEHNRSMPSRTLGADCPEATSDIAAAHLPEAAVAPPDQANI